MAGEWLKFDCSLPEKPEVLAITVALGWDDPDLTVGKLMRLFRWFDQHTVDGNAASVTPALLDRIVGVTGFVTAVASAGWLVISDSGVSLKNFDRHNGATAKGRALTAKRVANHKANAKGNGEGNAESVSSALPREEKRREEEIQEEPTVLVPEAADAARRPSPCPTEQIVELYHRHLPTLPRVEVLNDTRKRHIAARWREVLADPDIAKADSPRGAALDFFDWFFDHAAKSRFLTGRAKDWRADIDFLMTPTKFAKVIEGHYHKENA